MTLTELEINVSNLKYNYTYCNLFKERNKVISELGIYINKRSDFWEVYYTERASAELACIFYDEGMLYDYVFCYFKRISDCNCWFGGLMTKYPEDLIKKLKSLKIPNYEFSFYVQPKEIFDNGEISHGKIKLLDGTESYDIFKDPFEKSGDRAEAWEVNHSDEKEKISCGVFFKEKDAYDFFFYLEMKKYVNIKKRWW